MRLKHIYGRLQFGYYPKYLDGQLKNAPTQIIDHLINKSKVIKPILKPKWANWGEDDYEEDTEENYEHFQEMQTIWLQQLIKGNLRDKMTLFWHNLFVTRFDAYEFPSYGYHYHQLIYENALGNLRDLVRQVGKSPAMLFFLNGNENFKENPNENYARELLELFTLGRDQNYTQKDIYEIARAFTGWEVVSVNDSKFETAHWDGGEKKIFDQVGKWHYEDIIDILFEHRKGEMAMHLSTRLLFAFVTPYTSEEAINEFAKIILKNDFEILPILAVLFKSHYFFSEENIGTLIKSPLDLSLQLINFMGEQPSDKDLVELNDYIAFIGQELFNPPDVAGWKGHTRWISTEWLQLRWGLCYEMFERFIERKKENGIVDFLLNIGANIEDSSSIVDACLKYFFYKGESKEQKEYLLKKITEGFSVQYFNHLDEEEKKWMIINMVFYLFRLPEFQLT